MRTSNRLGFFIVFLHFRWDFLDGFSRLFSIWDSKKVQRIANLVELGKCCKMRPFSLSQLSIQLRTSLPKLLGNGGSIGGVTGVILLRSLFVRVFQRRGFEGIRNSSVFDEQLSAFFLRLLDNRHYSDISSN